MSSAGFYAVFMHTPALSCRGFTRDGADHCHLPRKATAMGDAAAVLYGIFVFVLLLLYVQACRKV